MRTGARHVAMLLEPAFQCVAPAVPELLARVLAQVYSAFPVGTPDLPKEVRCLSGAYLSLLFRKLLGWHRKA